jgi:hypothetical protein
MGWVVGGLVLNVVGSWSGLCVALWLKGLDHGPVVFVRVLPCEVFKKQVML